MKRSVFIKVIAVAAMSLMVLGGAASADSTVNTSLSIHANKTQVKKGHHVTISGTLSSNPTCRKHKLIILKGTGMTDRTSNNGGYSFRVKVKKNTTFKTRFTGAIVGAHPNQTTCNKSHSHGVLVKIKT